MFLLFTLAAWKLRITLSSIITTKDGLHIAILIDPDPNSG